jgi:hypothetical protein
VHAVSDWFFFESDLWGTQWLVTKYRCVAPSRAAGPGVLSPYYEASFGRLADAVVCCGGQNLMTGDFVLQSSQHSIQKWIFFFILKKYT